MDFARLEPGWRKVLVKPRPGGAITSASVSHVSPYGKVACSWKIAGDKLQVEVDMPLNCTAMLDLPGDEPVIIGSGQYSMTRGWIADERFPPTVNRPHFLQPITNTYVP